jgi:dipeptidyl aminopeptidase/acylaminoacyl peptidase
VAVDATTHQAVGTFYTEDFAAAEYFDRTYAQMQADVAATFPGEHVYIGSATSDRKKFIALVEGAQNPTGVYYLVDMVEPSLSKIGPRYRAIGAGDVGQVKSFTYQARDGMAIPAFLTLPPGSSGKNLPLVVMPHGGPHSRDDASFDPWSQFLASRGYAVLRPQFRGSSGYGAKHLEAGHFEWGLKMQDDLTDGVKTLIANGTVDASKVCIYGWSYGGYAAMAGLTLTPELYKCGVAGAGISDLLLFLGDSKRKSSSRGNFWKDYIGSPIDDRERLIATSPIKRVGKVRAPLLLLHPKDDTVVPLRQSTMMADALRGAGKQVEYIELEGDDHWLSKASTSKQVLRELERFLGANLK